MRPSRPVAEVLRVRPGATRQVEDVPVPGAQPPRAAVFEGHPKVILFYVPDGCDGLPALPALAPPFTKHRVTMTFADAGLTIRVAESVPGAWGAAINQVTSDARAERYAKQREAVLTRAQLYRGSTDPDVRERGALVEEQARLDDKIRSLKVSIAAAQGATGPLAAGILSKLRDDLATAQHAVTTVHARLRVLKGAEKVRAQSLQRDLERAFVDAAKELLDRETFYAIMNEAEAKVAKNEEDEDDEGLLP